MFIKVLVSPITDDNNVVSGKFFIMITSGTVMYNLI